MKCFLFQHNDSFIFLCASLILSGCTVTRIMSKSLYDILAECLSAKNVDRYLCIIPRFHPELVLLVAVYFIEISSRQCVLQD